MAMTEIRTYWIENKDHVPTIQDVEEAFKLVSENDIIVELNWFFPYSGEHSRTVTKSIVESMTPQEYFDNVIPHTYSV